ncbi:Polysialic acid transport protein KpsM [Pontiella desulfatans]|uniref:Polysialic acid transport protein KpsM n=1 Tax=Pontiella desulfatans TaxID=2750659 RepID=A0A6C2UBE5_PONDE|nr:ABC transporter permease [Pontiella desulfatans]VGO17410.1 Polysialic acid transport protein KpsM [Pontiella desulfatans]
MRELLKLQLRVLGALVLRETRATFGTSRLGYLWAIATPAFGVAVFVAVFAAAGRRPPFGSSLALFFATGFLTLEFFRKLSTSLMTTFNANKALLTYPVIKETDTLFARCILITSTYLVIMVLFYGVLIACGLASFPARPGQLMLAFCSISLLGFGFGTLNAVLLSKWDSWQYIENILTRPLIFISAVFYVPSALPAEAVAVLRWNPVLHLVEWVRVAYYSDYHSYILDKSIPVAMGMVLVLVGLIGERLYRKKRV